MQKMLLAAEIRSAFLTAGISFRATVVHNRRGEHPGNYGMLCLCPGISSDEVKNGEHAFTLCQPVKFDAGQRQKTGKEQISAPIRLLPAKFMYKRKKANVSRCISACCPEIGRSRDSRWESASFSLTARPG